MRELVELIGKRECYSTIDIWNQWKTIDNNIGILAKGEMVGTAEEIILTALEYSLSLKLQKEYGSIIAYVEAKYN